MEKRNRDRKKKHEAENKAHVQARVQGSKVTPHDHRSRDESILRLQYRSIPSHELLTPANRVPFPPETGLKTLKPPVPVTPSDGAAAASAIVDTRGPGGKTHSTA